MHHQNLVDIRQMVGCAVLASGLPARCSRIRGTCPLATAALYGQAHRLQSEAMVQTVHHAHQFSPLGTVADLVEKVQLHGISIGDTAQYNAALLVVNARTEHLLQRARAARVISTVSAVGTPSGQVNRLEYCGRSSRKRLEQTNVLTL